MQSSGSGNLIAERSYERLTENHLRRLALIARRDRAWFFDQYGYADVAAGFLLTALVQGGAQHYLGGGNGVKDLDVCSYFAKPPGGPSLIRRRPKKYDFGPSELGVHPADSGYRGRHVDCLLRIVDTQGDIGDPVATIRGHIRERGRSDTGERAVVALDPPELFATAVWPLP
ncbi:conserved hypothetical protein [Gordonia bronchialis DSM 43247]|uniref:Uncharacterized protein n=1 Tax=Gordonia bronchialis (strain ATCC 25592 / DSM 43247 / BCRC 13721 / JCM 3198 / KCTC 3076 / NBRC 16047 / NCTC 10667) TaxID=526226 RepID=D0L881_GORB4|nr:hypothetical protein [Gordonia bronchialis]ACY23829.1 conserved hypothetical protein [Gordonia bronchialis DSM 43247]MCC3321994.1 hypothetical protein [Gordonia bronchialis]QGS22864.1 hypothetical protein FOB84_00300 [Gordonia bronchialis]STQ66852.1 Uncharacterised protein [Gordonia bronchialis]